MYLADPRWGLDVTIEGGIFVRMHNDHGFKYPTMGGPINKNDILLYPFIREGNFINWSGAVGDCIFETDTGLKDFMWYMVANSIPSSNPLELIKTPYGSLYGTLTANGLYELRGNFDSTLKHTPSLLYDESTQEFRVGRHFYVPQSYKGKFTGTAFAADPAKGLEVEFMSLRDPEDKATYKISFRQGDRNVAFNLIKEKPNL
jgi:hypothetical protein